MKALVVLFILISIYYYIFTRNHLVLTTRDHIYFGTFVSIYLVIFYLVKYQKEFVFKLIFNLKNTDNDKYNAELSYQNEVLKYNLLRKQHNRCIYCHNPLLESESHKYLLTYKIPLDKGGINDITNLAIRCPYCQGFR
jgi:hypothetical protein